ncbi:MAG: 2-C-methyl-D-erythritol 4-phosphate cytidylyltransferase, partial [Deltaproteobacteria bacterium]|nr:2-C-methyl-D-erythritol 4-phosphate cytidylyltransferase [Deltaproteobacteria bacterium]
MLEERRQRARDSRQRPAPAIRAAAIVPAAGLGARMGAALPKQFLEIAGTPLLVHTLRAFLVLPEIKDVVVVVPPEHGPETEKLLSRYLPPGQMARLILTPGGATRQDSVRAGLDVLPPEIELVLVHDGARPLVSGEIIRRCLRGAMESGAAIAAIPVKDTLKQVAADGKILRSVNRTGLWQAQT